MKMEYYALDYVNPVYDECELVYDDQLYASWQEAYDAAQATGRPDLFDITMYRYIDLVDTYNTDKLEIVNMRVVATYE
jgi:hypothetical protein